MDHHVKETAKPNMTFCQTFIIIYMHRLSILLNMYSFMLLLGGKETSDFWTLVILIRRIIMRYLLKVSFIVYR
jgi:hypothetical protein